MVELAMTIGILSFAFVALLALVPVGLDTFRLAIDTTVETQIVQRVTSIARQAKFSELSKLDCNAEITGGIENGDLFFDEEGNEIKSQDGAVPTNATYSAAIRLEGRSALPANDGRQEINPNLATLAVTVRPISAPKRARFANILIANNGL